jgi:hypothetical protein
MFPMSVSGLCANTMASTANQFTLPQLFKNGLSPMICHLPDGETFLTPDVVMFHAVGRQVISTTIQTSTSLFQFIQPSTKIFPFLSVVKQHRVTVLGHPPLIGDNIDIFLQGPTFSILWLNRLFVDLIIRLS